jgi:hypothetical protein
MSTSLLEKRIVYVERKNCVSLKILREIFYRSTVATPKLSIDLLEEFFLLISSFPSSPLFFSSSLTWFSIYFIYLSATPYSTATTERTKKAIIYHHIASLQHLQSCT